MSKKGLGGVEGYTYLPFLIALDSNPFYVNIQVGVRFFLQLSSNSLLRRLFTDGQTDENRRRRYVEMDRKLNLIQYLFGYVQSTKTTTNTPDNWYTKLHAVDNGVQRGALLRSFKL